MSLWWLEPEWKDATCARCGCNIWDSGGDPDHGVCYECWHQQWDEAHQMPEPQEPEPEPPAQEAGGG